MPFMDLSSDDINRSKLIDSGWYRVKIEDIGESLSKDQGSTNYPVKGTIIRNEETGDVSLAGFPTPHWSFNSKAPGFVIPFLRALGEDNIQAGRVDLNAAKGCEILVLIEQDTYNGRPVNRINHNYRKA